MDRRARDAQPPRRRRPRRLVGQRRRGVPRGGRAARPARDDPVDRHRRVAASEAGRNGSDGGQLVEHVQADTGDRARTPRPVEEQAQRSRLRSTSAAAPAATTSGFRRRTPGEDQRRGALARSRAPRLRVAGQLALASRAGRPKGSRGALKSVSNHGRERPLLQMCALRSAGSSRIRPCGRAGRRARCPRSTAAGTGLSSKPPAASNAVRRTAPRPAQNERTSPAERWWTMWWSRLRNAATMPSRRDSCRRTSRRSRRAPDRGRTPRRIRVKTSACTRTSESTNRTMSALVCRTPLFRAAAGPALRGVVTTTTSSGGSSAAAIAARQGSIVGRARRWRGSRRRAWGRPRSAL